MPLRDHFRSPVNDTHSWDEVHGLWPGMIVLDLFAVLPSGYRAAPNVHLGTGFEVDVAGFDETADDRDGPVQSAGDGTAVLTAPAPTLTAEAELFEPDEYEVRVYDTSRYRQLVAVIEIISPSNKDRPDAREQLIGKAASLLRQGVSVSLVDPVTIRRANLYAELLARLGQDVTRIDAAPTYAATLRTRGPTSGRRGRPSALIDTWYYPMELGQPLPTIPIWLGPTLHVLLPMESSYETTCRVLHIG